MVDITSLTLNLALDNACEAASVAPLHKLRATNTLFDPGSGGINVARVVAELAAAQIGAIRPILIAGTTRISMTVHNMSMDQEYRFVADGPEISLDEFAACDR
jgi:6-phosphofructokinase 2